MENLSKVFKALGDETRLKILMLISSKVICQKGISKHLEISDSAVSQHIKVLKDLNILRGYKDGYFVFYQINNEVFDKCIKFIETLGSESSYAFLEKENIININRCNSTCKGNHKCCNKREEY